MELTEAMRAQARKNHTLLLQCIAEVSQKRVADLIGVSEATMSGIKNEQLERIAALVVACGLRLAPITERSYDDDYIRSVHTLAKRALELDPIVRRD
jgi:DNA-binding XRE family transcriptional regulator